MRHAGKIGWETTHDGRRLRVALRAGRGNVIDAAACADLAGVLAEHAASPSLRGITLEAEGDHFSFGASVPEHVPGKVRDLLRGLHGVVTSLLRAPVPVVASVRGACLGGGLELVLPCHRIVAAPNAKLGLPEVTLGMFAPAGSALLPTRVRRGLADEMLVTGRVLTAAEALAAGLVDEVTDDPEHAAVAWFERHLLPRSASGVRFATRGARATTAAVVEAAIAELERTFVDETMRTHDAMEGVAAFAEKRAAQWRDA